MAADACTSTRFTQSDQLTRASGLSQQVRPVRRTASAARIRERRESLPHPLRTAPNKPPTVQANGMSSGFLRRRDGLPAKGSVHAMYVTEAGPGEVRRVN